MTVDMEQSDEELFSDIDNLLKEICEFLKKTSNDLNSSQKSQAQNLIDQCKKQLTVLNRNKTNIGTEYVVMTPDLNPSPPLLPKSFPKLSPQPTEAVSVNEQIHDYTNSDKILSSQTSIENDNLVCLFNTLPAKNTSKQVKYGELMYDKKMFFIGYSRKVFAAIHDSWLLLYWSKGSSKPFCCLNLRFYDAQQDETDVNELDDSRNGTFRLDTKKKASFRVFHTGNNKKIFSFIADSSKDRRQWVCSIKKEHASAMSKDYSCLESNYGKNSDLDNGENIYDVVNISRDQESVPKKEHIKVKGPALPLKPQALKPSLSRSSSTSELEIYDELVIKTASPESDVSENEDYCELDQFQVIRKKDVDNIDNGDTKNEPLTINKVENEPKTPPPLPKMRNPVVKTDETLDEDNSYEEFYVVPANIIPETPKDNLNSSVIKITRNTIKSEILSNNFETFSRNSKIETFQASPLKDPPQTSPFHLNSEEVSVISMESCADNTDENKSELPMVLLKPTEGNEPKVKKKKSPSMSIQKRQKMLFKQ